MNKRVGILGGGQLGTLLAQSLARLGCQISIYDPSPDAPACRLSDSVHNGSWTDYEKLKAFFAMCDIVTYEFENVETDLLFELQKSTPLCPSADVLRITQNRGREKMFLVERSLPHPRFSIVGKETDLSEAVAEFGFPCIAKTTFGGYDGKGQFLLESAEAGRAFCERSKDSSVTAREELILEEKIDLDMEVSCIVGRDAYHNEVVFPILENVHREHILDISFLPAQISEKLQSKIAELALKAARDLNVIGLLTTEFFLTRAKPSSDQIETVDGWYILINEFAPRPHNSGHLTMKACDLSQFDILARVLADVPLRQPLMASDGTYAMANLLGDLFLGNTGGDDSQSNHLDLAALSKYPAIIDVLLYGKTEARPKRKMGHLIASGLDRMQLTQVVDEFRREFSLSQKQR